MRRVALLTAHYQEHDAVGHDTRHMRALLTARGYEAEVFAPAADRALKSQTRPMREVRAFLRAPDDVLLYHYAVAWPEALRLFEEVQCRRVLKYHNVTPPEFYGPYHQGYAALCAAGREMLPRFLKTRPDLLLGDSAFNCAELSAADASACRVVPPFHEVAALRERPADTRWLRRLGPTGFRRPRTVVMVGRVVPNKGHAHLVRALAVARRLSGLDIRLIFAGRSEDALGAYRRYLDDLIEREALSEHVLFTGRIDGAALKACYLAADIFAIASEHEGFCVPLIEAMSFGLPIVALDRGAVGETLGSCGVLLAETDPSGFAAAIVKLLTDGDAAFALGRRGLERYESTFRNEIIAERFVDALAALPAGKTA